jgi:hypothetical protein
MTAEQTLADQAKEETRQQALVSNEPRRQLEQQQQQGDGEEN